MNKNISAILLLFVGIFFFSSCLEDECIDQREYFRYDPVYMTLDEIRVPFDFDNSQRELQNPGKMYYYKEYLFINEMGQGVHVYNNQNPENPTYEVFYKIPGNFDIVIKDDIMIADNVMDLITLDISSIQSPSFVSRVENYKETYMSGDENQRYYAYSERSNVKEIVNCSDSNFGFNEFWRNDVFFTTFDNAAVFNGAAETTGSSGSGIGGSTARFTIVNDYLYAVDQSSLISMDISSPSSPSVVKRNQLGWGIETIFPYNGYLFIGSNSGMYVYGLDNPDSPSKLSTFEHARACDPVVAQGNYAYVTLRDGSRCEGFTNQLEIIDISNINSPNLIKIHQMDNPHGLSINGDVLYLSEGEYGLKILDVSNKENVKELSYNRNVKSTDVIYLGNGHLLSVGADGFHQFDVSNPKEIKELSFIAVQ